MADPHIEDRDTTWARTGKDLFSGAAGGVAQVLLGISTPQAQILQAFQHFFAVKSIQLSGRV
jgi:hypothetical protein